MVSAAQGKLNHCHWDTGAAQGAFECGAIDASGSYTASFNDQDVLTGNRSALVQVLNAKSRDLRTSCVEEGERQGEPKGCSNHPDQQDNQTGIQHFAVT